MHFRARLDLRSVIDLHIVVTHAMTQDVQARRHEFHTRDSAVIDAETQHIRPSSHKKVMHGGDRIQFISVLCERKREREKERERERKRKKERERFTLQGCAPG